MFVCVCQLLSCVRLFVIPWTIAHQAPLSMGFSSQEYQSGLPFPSLGDLPNPGIELWPPILQAVSLPSELSEGKMVQMILFEKQKQRHRDREHQGGKQEDGRTWETGIDTGTLLTLCIKQITNENTLSSTKNST